MDQHSGVEKIGVAPTRNAPKISNFDIYGPLLRSAVFVVFTYVTGVIGYLVIAAITGAKNPNIIIDAIYMTTITLTTVGYGETIDMTDSPGGRIFTILLLLTGVGAFANFFSHLTAFFIEGKIQELLWRQRMSKTIVRLSGHIVVCGGGHTGRAVLQELVATERPFVLIEASRLRATKLAESLRAEFPVVIGDATDDDTLLDAGIDRASGLITCFANDKDNLIVTVSARILNKGIRVVSGCRDEKVEQKLQRAGADKVITATRIGGLRLVSEMIRPTAVSFLDLMLRGPDKALRVESVDVTAHSPFAGRPIGQLRARNLPELLIMALRKADGSWVFNPDDTVVLAVGVGIVYMGDAKARATIEGVLAHG